MRAKSPIKAQVLIYKIVNNQPQVLCLKRSIKDGGFWHVITGTLEKEESLMECITREIKEEINIREITHVSEELKKYIWHKDNSPILVVEFCVQIPHDSAIVLNEEHSDFKWLKPKEARQILEKNSAKELLDLFIEHIKNDKK